MNNTPEWDTPKEEFPSEETPREAYTYTPTPQELADISAVLSRDNRMPHVFCFIFCGIIALLLFALSAPPFCYGMVLGALLVMEILLLAGQRSNKKALAESTGKMLANFCSNRYEFYENYVTVTCYRGEDMTRYQKILYPDIVSVRDTGELVLMQVNAVEFFILRKRDLAPDARILALAAESKQKTEAVQKKSATPLTALLIILACASFPIATSVVSSIVEAAVPHPFPYYYVFLACLPLPLITLIYGIVKKAKREKGGVAIVLGAVFAALLALFACVSFANPNAFDPYDHTDAHLLYTEQTVGIDLPSGGYHKTYLADDEEGYYWCETVVYFSEEEAAAFEAALATLPFKTGAELKALEDEGLYALWYDGTNLTYYLYYNAVTGEFNAAGEPDQTLRYFDLGYDPEANALYICEYDMEFYSEDYWDFE